MKTYITPACDYKGTRIAILQVSSSNGDTFKIMKKCINYVAGRNLESYKVMGAASTFTSLEACVEKFENLVNSDRVARGKSPIKITVE